MASMRSMDSFLRGFSISFMLAALVMGAVGLVLGRERAGWLKRVALVHAIWLATVTAVSLHYCS
jgi:cytochrome c biogenesis protein CcdA